MRSLLVLWDIDYTLIGTSGVGQQLYRRVFREMFGRELPGFAPMAGRTDRAIIRDTLAMAGIPEPQRHVDQFIARMAELAPAGRELAAERSRALPGAAAALAALARYAPGTSDGHEPAALSVVQSVLTGNVRQVADVKLMAAGLAGYLDLGIGAYGEAHEVRAELVPLARQNAARRYGADFGGAATVLVGDTELDVAAALATGARVVGVATGGTTAAELAAAGACAVLPDLTDTPATLSAILGDGSRPATRLPGAADTETLLSTARPFPRRPSTAAPTSLPRKGLSAKASLVALHLPTPCQELLELQHGVIARWQLTQAGFNVRAIDARLQRGRWQTLYQGVYATYTGEPSRRAVLWSAVLRAGQGAALGYHTAAEVDGLADRPCEAIHVIVSSSRRVSLAPQERGKGMPCVVIHYRARADQAIHPSRTPPRTRIEETTLDLTQLAASLDEAISWLARACSRRLTTAALLRSAMAARPKLRWRTELTGALADVRSGAHSPLEWRYLRDVELRHGLPRATRQSHSRAGRRTRYLDNEYPEFGLVVELDGSVAHPVEERWRDIHRDNVSAASGMVTLRYNWADVTTDPCRVASEIAAVLSLRGWTGRLRPCGPTCTAAIP